jgi:pimeloyl-ACP methyl ester carboxylesterase
VTGPTTSSTVELPSGRQLHVVERGGTAPAVLFEAGAGAPLLSWGRVPEMVAPSARTVAYDRAGVGESPPASGSRTLDALSRDLVDLLDHLGGRFVLVGHSWGGPIVRRAAAARPHAVVGLVLVDPTDEGCSLFLRPSVLRQQRAMLRMLPLVNRLGLTATAIRRSARTVGEELAGELARQSTTRTAARTLALEMQSEEADLRDLLRDPPTVPDIPFVVISGARKPGRPGSRRAELIAAHARSAAAMRRGRHVLAGGSDHLVPLTEPGLVAREIDAVLAAPSSPGAA